MAYAQNTVTDTVTDGTSGSALPGVNVIVQGIQTVTVTDLDGNFTINAGPESKLEFSFVGCITESIPINGQTNIALTLGEDIAKLDEVVVKGYGTQKKSDLTGSVAVVNTENLEKIASSVIIKKNEFNLF
jgi:hypothetical protein